MSVLLPWKPTDEVIHVGELWAFKNCRKIVKNSVRRYTIDA